MKQSSRSYKARSKIDGAAIAAVFIVTGTIFAAIILGNVPLSDLRDWARSTGNTVKEKIANLQDMRPALPDFYFADVQPAAGENAYVSLASYEAGADMAADKGDDLRLASAQTIVTDSGGVIYNWQGGEKVPAVRMSQRQKQEQKQKSGRVPSAATEPAAGNTAQAQNAVTKQQKEVSDSLNTASRFYYEAPYDDLDIEAVLVPRQTTVISSSHDGKIAEVNVKAGDVFKKGDVLIRYDCRDIQAEAEIARFKEKVIEKKAESGYRLFNLDLISETDRMGLEMEEKQATARARVFNEKLQHCIIRARFDGRVTNRLANPGEYTRTDRVLMEVASTETLDAEFLIPSVWLRWVNIGAPLNILVSETGKTYSAEIIRIYGEVDPVSQSIQVRAKLDAAGERLLPGMSGQASLSVNDIRAAGVRGYLEPVHAQKGGR